MSGVIPPGAVLPPDFPEAEVIATEGRTRRPRSGVSGAGRFDEINRFVDQTMAGLSRAEALVWLTLWRDARKGRSRTSYSRLASRVGVNRSTVSRALKTLRTRGLIRVIYAGGYGRGTTIYGLESVHP